MIHKRNLTRLFLIFCFLLLPQFVLGWNATGHELVAAIAWDNMTPTARQRAIALFQAAPQDACLRNLFPNDSRPLADRQREFFIVASTWSDIVRPNDKPGQPDTRPCIRFHRGDWHFINFFWEGLSGAAGGNAPKDLPKMQPPEVNAVERLKYFRPFVMCSKPACGTTNEERATTLAWILHLVGDLHQPLHTTARVTETEPKGDQGGNLFKLPPNAFSLHSYWDGIINRSIPQPQTESVIAYINRVEGIIVQNHPRAAMESRLRSGDVLAWTLEGFVTTKQKIYPESLKRDQIPNDAYQQMAFTTAKEAIALGGYRLADLLNRMLVS